MKIGRIKDETLKLFKKRGSLPGVIFLLLLLLVSYLIYINNKGSAVVVNGKTYCCSTLSKEDEKALEKNTELISSARKMRDDSTKFYDEKLSACGTEKEYDTSPEIQDKLNKLNVPPDIQAGLDEYRRTRTYTIKDFQECRKFWEDAKKESYDTDSAVVKIAEDYEKEILTKNNFRIRE